jgi:hypothetical protein
MQSEKEVQPICCSGLPVCENYSPEWVLCKTCEHGEECHDA